MMESESRHSTAAEHAVSLSLSLGAHGQVATEKFPEDSLILQLSSWGQDVHHMSLNLEKTNHGSSHLESAARRGDGNVSRSLFQNGASYMEGPNIFGSEEDFGLTLGPANASASRLSPSRCDGYGHGIDMCKNGNDRGHFRVDLGLRLTTKRECHSTIIPFRTQGIVSEISMETPEGFQGSACGLREHDGSISVQQARNSSRHEGLFRKVPLENAKEFGLRLGLSGSTLCLDSDAMSLDVQEARLEASTHEHIPVVDEGSTSAKLMESGGNFEPLMGFKLALESPSSAGSQACMMPVEASEANTLERPLLSQDNSGGRNLSFGEGSESVTLEGLGAETFNAACPTGERATKKCKFKGCSKGARGASGLCIAHGGGRRCQKENCSKGAEGRTMFCKAHGGGRRCQSLGCIKSAEGRTDFCIAHGGGRRCMYEGCSKAARGRSGLCIRHGGGKRCQREGCTRSAEGFSGLCISHGGGRRCQFPGCGKGAQGSTKFCKGHGGGRRCEFDRCAKGAEGSTPFCKAHGGGKRCTFGGGKCTKSVHGGTAFCVAHGGGKRCSIPGCTKSARGRTDYCVRHGGGKRCKIEHCDKSAQGSTDYCKAHGGGKRCLWGQECSVYDGSLLDEASIHGIKACCEKFGRGKAGLCSTHVNLSEHYHPGLSSNHNIEGTSSEGTFCKQHRQLHSDSSEQSSQLDEEPDFMVEEQPKSSKEGSWGPQEHLSSPMVFKAQFAAGGHVSTDLFSQDMGDSIGAGNSHLKECLAVDVLPGHGSSLFERAPNSSLYFPLEHRLQTSQPRLQKDFVVPFSRIQMKGACFSELHQFADSAGHACSEDPEERVHGGGHFMALRMEKITGSYPKSSLTL